MSVNKVLIVFLGVVGLMIFGVWQFAHTERFARFVSSRMKESIFKSFKGEASFQSIEIGLFPLSTRAKKISLRTKTERGQEVYCEFDEVGFYFSIFDLFSSSLSIDKVALKNGFVRHAGERSSSQISKKPFRIEKIFSFYKKKKIGKFLQSINKFQIKNTNLFDFVEVGDVEVQMYKNYIVLMGNLEKISVGKIYSGINKSYENIDINLEIERRGVRVKSLEIKDELEVITFAGEIEELARGHKIKGDLRYRGRLKRVFHLLDRKFFRSSEMAGYVDANVNITGNVKQPVFKVEFQGKRVETPYFIADDMQGEVVVKSGMVSVNKVKLDRMEGTLRLLDPVDIYDIQNTSFIPNSARFKLENLFTNEAFRVLKFMDDVKGRISGLIDVEWSEENIVFAPYEGMSFKKFRLNSSREDIPILKNEKLTFYGGEFVVGYDGEVEMNVDAGFEGCRFSGKGTAGNGKINFLVEKGTVDFLKLGEIAGVKMHGKGDFKMAIAGPFEEVWLDFGLDLKEFEMAGYKLKKFVGEVKVSLKDNVLYFNNLKSFQETFRLIGDGNLMLKDKSELNLNIKFEKVSLAESYLVAGPLFNHLKEKFKNVKARYSGSVSFKVDFDKDTAVSEGNIYTEEVSFYVNEYIDKLYSKFIYKNKKMIFDNIEVRKGTGVLTGRLEIEPERDYFKYQAKLSQLDIRDLYLYQLSGIQYKGKVSGESQGEGTLSRYNTKTRLESKQGFVGKAQVKGGNLAVRTDQKGFEAKGSFIDDIVKFESNIIFGKKSSHFKGSVDAPDIGIFSRLISKRNFSNKAVAGKAKFIWNTSFNVMSSEIIDMNVDIKRFNFKYGQLKLNLVKGRDRIVVQDGKIKKWDIGIIGKDNFISTVGRGDLSGDYKVKQNFTLDTSLGMLLNADIEDVYGYLFGQQILAKEGNNVKNEILFESKDVFLKMKKIADPFTKVSFKISMSKNKAIIENINAIYGDGTVSGSGHVILNVPYPLVDIKMSMENSKISFFKKSGAVASANIHIKGERPPYIIGGKAVILHGEIKDELNNILSYFSPLKNYSKYIPQKTKSNVLQYLNYDLDVNISRPVTISNSLLDMKMEGSVKVSRSWHEPFLDGEFSVVRGPSRIMFKNHDFIISEGRLNFNDTDSNKNSSLKVVGSAEVDDYNVRLNIFGEIKSTQMELTSVPPLPQQDILSLLALGVTSSMDKDLNEKDRQSITTLSFGSLVVEQLKLQEGLTSSLGLRLSVEPEFEEKQSGPLEGRVVGKDPSEKSKAATKLRVQKKISNNVNLSLSSTVGDSNSQKQIMNIIYQLNKNISLEGIYEINSSDTAAEESLSSGGVDIKYRISF